MVQYSRYKLRKGELTGSGPRKLYPPELFVAYRFGVEKSDQFRQSIEIELRKTDSLNNIIVTDGHVPPGDPWLTTIRKRIQRSRLVLADVTALNIEVLFECGLAWGLNKLIVPVVESLNSLNRLPHWLTDLQIGEFKTTQGLAGILDAIHDRISKSTRGRQLKRCPKGVPGKVVWLRGKSEFEQYRDNMSQTATRYELDLPEEDLPVSLNEVAESLVNHICGASLVVASLTNSPSDTFIHFAVGMLVSRPTCGETIKKLKRRMILAVPSSLNSADVISDSARRCRNVIKIVSLSSLNQNLINYGKMYEEYLMKVSEPKLNRG